MDIIDGLLGEHGVFYALFDWYAKSARRAKTLDEVQKMTRPLTAALIAHAKLEDRLFFPALERDAALKKALVLMDREHQGIEGALLGVENCSRKAEARDLLLAAIASARAHFGEEERFVFPRARQVLDEKKLAKLTRRWARVRGVAVF